MSKHFASYWIKVELKRIEDDLVNMVIVPVRFDQLRQVLNDFELFEQVDAFIWRCKQT